MRIACLPWRKSCAEQYWTCPVYTVRIVNRKYQSFTFPYDETRHVYFSDQWQVLEERVDAATAADRQFVWGLRYVDELVLRDRDTTANGTLDERLYALQDALFNVVALVDNTGTVQERFAYQPYGESEVLTPTFTSRASSLHDWEIRFTGRELDAATGLQLHRNRHLHLQLGRWLSRDPIGYIGSPWNLYKYVSANPLRYRDALGLLKAGECCNPPAPGNPNAFNLKALGILHGTGGVRPGVAQDLLMGIDHFQIFLAVLDIIKFGAEAPGMGGVVDILKNRIVNEIEGQVSPNSNLIDLAQNLLNQTSSKIMSNRGFTLWVEIEWVSCDQAGFFSGCCNIGEKHKKQIQCEAGGNGGLFGGRLRFPLPTIDNIASCIKAAKNKILKENKMQRCP